MIIVTRFMHSFCFSGTMEMQQVCHFPSQLSCSRLAPPCYIYSLRTRQPPDHSPPLPCPSCPTSITQHDQINPSRSTSNGRRRRGGEAGGGDGAGAGGVRRREHLLQAGGVRRHGHEGPRRLPLPLRLRRPRAARILRREEEPNKVDVESGGAVIHLRPHRGLAGAEPVHLRDEADLGDVRVRHDQPDPGHHLRSGGDLPVRDAGRAHLLRSGQGGRHLLRRGRRHAAHLLQGRRHHAMAQHHQPRRHAHPWRWWWWSSTTRSGCSGGPCDGFGACDGQLLLLRAVADPAGEAEPGVPVPLLEHGADVPDEHAAVRGIRALLRQGRRAVEAGTRHQAAVRGVLWRPRLRGDAGGALLVRQAPRPSLRLRLQPSDAPRRRRAELPPPRREAAPRQRPRRRPHRHGPLRRALGQRTRDRHRGSQGRRAAPPRRRPPPNRRRRRAASSFRGGGGQAAANRQIDRSMMINSSSIALHCLC